MNKFKLPPKDYLEEIFYQTLNHSEITLDPTYLPDPELLLVKAQNVIPVLKNTALKEQVSLFTYSKTNPDPKSQILYTLSLILNSLESHLGSIDSFTPQSALHLLQHLINEDQSIART